MGATHDNMNTMNSEQLTSEPQQPNDLVPPELTQRLNDNPNSKEPLVIKHRPRKSFTEPIPAQGSLSGVPIKKEMIIEAIMRSKGNLTKAAISLKCSRRTIANCAKVNPDVQQVIEECRERTIDDVEDAFLKKALNGDTTASIFFLKTRARERGYDQDFRADMESVTRAALDFAINKSRNPAESQK